MFGLTKNLLAFVWYVDRHSGGIFHHSYLESPDLVCFIEASLCVLDLYDNIYSSSWCTKFKKLQQDILNITDRHILTKTNSEGTVFHCATSEGVLYCKSQVLNIKILGCCGLTCGRGNALKIFLIICVMQTFADSGVANHLYKHLGPLVIYKYGSCLYTYKHI